MNINAEGLVCFNPGLDPFVLIGEPTTLDVVPPVIGTPTVTGITRTPTGWIVTYTVPVTDNTDPNPTVVCTPPSGSEFPAGTSTTITCVATDEAANTASLQAAIFFPPF